MPTHQCAQRGEPVQLLRDMHVVQCPSVHDAEGQELRWSSGSDDKQPRGRRDRGSEGQESCGGDGLDYQDHRGHLVGDDGGIEEMVEALRAKVGIGIWDTGCRKTVAGATWIKTYMQALAGLGYTAEFAACTEKFKFGNQGALACTRCWYLPVMMYGEMGTLAVHEVAGDCPLLISEESMTRLGVVLRLRAKRIGIEDLEIAGEELELHPRSGHPIVRPLPTTRNLTAWGTLR